MKKQIITVIILAAAAFLGHAVMDSLSKTSYEVATTGSGSSCNTSATTTNTANSE